MPYLIDSNIFIQAHRKYYPFDVMPGFWNAIKSAADQAKIFSVDKVRVELVDNGRDGDELARFCKKELPKSFFLNSQEAILEYGKVVNWAQTSKRKFTTNALSKFMATDYADPWLVAYAIRKEGFIIVTEEKEDPLIRKDIPIPEVCKEFNLPWRNTISLLRELQIRL